ncbi:hypothetical protein [Azospirillum sp. sgz301742]
MLIGRGLTESFTTPPMTWATYDASKDGPRTALWSNDAAFDGDSFSRSTSMGGGVFLFVHNRFATGTSPGTAGIYAFAIQVNADNTITVGTETAVVTASFLNWAASLSVLKVETNKAVCFYNGPSAPYAIYAATLAVDPSTLAVTVTNATNNVSSVLANTRIDHSHAIMLDSTKIVLTGRSDSTTYRVRSYALNWNSAAGKVDAMSSTSQAVGNTSLENGGRLVKISATQAILTATKTGTPAGISSVILTHSGTGITTSAVVQGTLTNGTWADNFNSNDMSVAGAAMTYGMTDPAAGMKVWPVKSGGTTPTVGTQLLLAGSSTDYRYCPLWLSSTRLAAVCSDATTSGDRIYLYVLDYDAATNALSRVNGPVMIEPSVGSFGLESHRIDANRILAVYASDDGVTSAKVLSIV